MWLSVTFPESVKGTLRLKSVCKIGAEFEVPHNRVLTVYWLNKIKQIDKSLTKLTCKIMLQKYTFHKNSLYRHIHKLKEF